MRLVAAFALALLIAVPALSQQSNDRGFSLEIDQSRENIQLNLYELNERAFRQDFRVQIINPGNVDALREARIYDHNGREVDFRTGVTLGDRTFVLGTSIPGQTLAISSIDEVDGRIQITFAVLDRDGKFLENLGRDEVVFFDDQGRQSCFTYQPAARSDVKMSVGIAIDISGSMSGYEQEINGSLSHFLNTLHSNAYCSVVEFNHEYDYLVHNQRCNRVRNLSVSRPSGGTDIFTALSNLYFDIHEQSNPVELVLVISDGDSSTRSLDSALAMKGDIPTFVNWLGHYNPDYALAQFADAEIFGAISPDGTLPQFFQAARESIVNQFVGTTCQ